MDFKGRLITTYIEPLMESGDFDTGKNLLYQRTYYLPNLHVDKKHNYYRFI